ncbi:MAG: ABC transporter permease, partial [Muribaculaceae bacterium]|nr:ABC transporter permease [Muribaculaceae bacterium]
MILEKQLADLGQYCSLMAKVLSVPDRWKVFLKRTISEIYKLGIDSIPLVITISVFIGAVITIQMQLNISSPLLPAYAVGLTTREIILLEFSS